jgi:hypothetical protein
MSEHRWNSRGVIAVAGAKQQPDAPPSCPARRRDNRPARLGRYWAAGLPEVGWAARSCC